MTLSRLRIMFRFSFATALGVLLSSDVWAEARVSQVLITKQSKIRFGLQGNPLNFSGGFRSYSGTLDRGRTIGDSRISFAVDLSKVRLDPAFGGLDMVSFEPLFQKIPHPVGKFISTSIVPDGEKRGGNRFQVTGNWVRGGKSEMVHFPIVVIASTVSESRLQTSVVRRIQSSDAPLPMALGPNGAEGNVSGELVFHAVK